MAKLCLNMIVKNELKTLGRCLSAVAPHIDAWVIGDLGSSDGTPAFIRDFFANQGIPGQLIDIPFRNFAQARNDALNACRQSAFDFSYILLAESYLELVVLDPAFRDSLQADCYMIEQRAGVSYYNRRLLKRETGGYYRGVTYEFLEFNGPTAMLSGLYFRVHPMPNGGLAKIEQDIVLLREALKTEQDPHLQARYTFYLANCYRDIADPVESRKFYLERAKMGYWEEEIYLARLGAARAGTALALPFSTVIDELVDLYNDYPHRAEALHEVAKLCRQAELWEQAYSAAKEAESVVKPKAGLFLEDWIYDYGVRDELSIAAYWLGHYQEAFDLCEALLNEGRLPPAQVQRVIDNRNFAAAKLGLPLRKKTPIPANTP